MSYDYDQFLVTVQQKAGISREKAVLAARATLETLAERLSSGEARDLAEQLPPELTPYLPPRGDAEGFDVEEFLRRIAEREGVDVATANRHARAVFAALGRFVDEHELADMAAELSKDYAALVAEAEGRFFRLLPAEEFYERVADRAGIRPEDAPRATGAVLETLAERIAGGEVPDLMARLPIKLHGPLQRGILRSGGRPQRMSAEHFMQRIAEREGVTPAVAAQHARAVLTTLREAVGDDEFFDVTVQLPPDPAAALALS